MQRFAFWKIVTVDDSDMPISPRLIEAHPELRTRVPAHVLQRLF
jgi:hypothetical protein